MFCCCLCCCKQKVSKKCMTLYSVLLLLSGLFTIYVSACLVLNIEILGGLLGTSHSEPVTNGLNSYMYMFIFISGVMALIFAMLGICTTKVDDKCCITTMALSLLSMTILFTIVAVVLVILHLKDQPFVSTFCSQPSIFTLPENSNSSFQLFLSKVANKTDK